LPLPPLLLRSSEGDAGERDASGRAWADDDAGDDDGDDGANGLMGGCRWDVDSPPAALDEEDEDGEDGDDDDDGDEGEKVEAAGRAAGAVSVIGMPVVAGTGAGTGRGAGTNRKYPPWLSHLVIGLFQNRPHLFGNGTHNHQ